ncbi:hypothetical protein PoB_006922700 [Plakobranchus ocellatus]|uniref:Uncharacterized protein n=1 Tax=Plakobranchus ocellatus TaxID=259542 RepID=A0AAV4DER1_9GAST|nr:hypothetical protein PoB_006922700 [Plakobranchus ocellatus]
MCQLNLQAIYLILKFTGTSLRINVWCKAQLAKWLSGRKPLFHLLMIPLTILLSVIKFITKKFDAKIQELERKIKVLSSSSSSSSINNITPTRQSKYDSSTSPYQDVLPSKHRMSYRDVLVQKPPLQQRHLHSGSPSRSSSLSSLHKHSPLPESKSSSAINNSILHSSNDSVRPARDTSNVCEHDVTP